MIRPTEDAFGEALEQFIVSVRRKERAFILISLDENELRRLGGTQHCPFKIVTKTDALEFMFRDPEVGLRKSDA